MHAQLLKNAGHTLLLCLPTQHMETRLHSGHIGNGYTCQGETPIRLQGRANGDHGIRQVVRLMTASGGLATRRTLLDA
jgi:hypothetical protein